MTNKKWTKLKKGILAGTLCTILQTPLFAQSEYNVPPNQSGVYSLTLAKKQFETNVSPFIKNSLEGLLFEQRKKLGISYKETPKVEFFHEEGKESIPGRYNPRNKSIQLNAVPVPNESAGDPNLNLYALSLFKDTRISNVLNHELGHLYVNTMAERLAVSDNLRKTFVGITLEEGIAAYFDLKMAGLEIKPILKDRYEDSSLFSSRGINRYEIGLDIVAPILDKYGVEKGTELILKNMPRLLTDLKSLQNDLLISKK